MNKNIDIRYIVSNIRLKKSEDPDSDNILNIEYDVDDTLNNLNDFVFDKLGFEPPRRFRILDCTDQYTPEQIKAILDCYGNPEIFKSLRFVPGAKDICSFEKTGKARVGINSKNFNEDILKIKMADIIREIPGISTDRIFMTLGAGYDKRPTDADIIVEDCLENIHKYSDKAARILLNRSYNQSEVYGTTDAEHNIIRVESLVEANAIIKSVVDAW